MNYAAATFIPIIVGLVLLALTLLILFAIIKGAVLSALGEHAERQAAAAAKKIVA